MYIKKNKAYFFFYEMNDNSFFIS